jgi:transposase-like protein
VPPVSADYFKNANCARGYLEKIRWPEGAVCPRCCAAGRRLTPAANSKTHARDGLYQCIACRRQFSVTLGTLLEDAHTPLHKWLLAICLICSDKEGIGALQLQQALGLGSYRTAWLMCHRIRWALQKAPMPGLMQSAGHVPSASPRRPIRIPLPFDQALRGLLEVAQEPRDRFKSDRRTGAKMERRQRSP